MAKKSDDTPAPMSAVEQLRAYNEAQQGDETATLPASGLLVRFPKLVPQSALSKAQRLAKKKTERIPSIMIADLVRFGAAAERFTLSDVDQLPFRDFSFLVAAIMGEDDEPEAGADDDEDGEEVRPLN